MKMACLGLLGLLMLASTGVTSFLAGGLLMGRRSRQQIMREVPVMTASAALMITAGSLYVTLSRVWDVLQ